MMRGIIAPRILNLGQEVGKQSAPVLLENSPRYPFNKRLDGRRGGAGHRGEENLWSL
jgi:hypothetical protein